jgi:LCP family protein required for cell wall assembly
MSIVVPGSGHLLLKKWRRAAVFLAIDVLIVAGTVWLLSGGAVGVLQLLVQPAWVRGVIAANLLLALFRALAALDVFLLERPRFSGVMAGGLAFALVVGLVAPHLFIQRRAVALLNVLESVFPSEGDIAAAFEQQRLIEEELARMRDPLGVVAGAEDPRRSGTTLPAGAGFPAAMGGDRVVEPEFDPLSLNRITVLLAGGDAGPGRTGLRTDTMVIATLNIDSRDGALVTISRELVEVPLPRHLQDEFRTRQDQLHAAALAAEAAGTSLAGEPEPLERDRRYFLDRINAVYPYARNLTSMYPDSVLPGMDALRDTLAYALGIHIDYWVLVDMGGFVDLVDALGGVWVTSQEAMHVRFSPAREGEAEIVINIEAGRYHLDGHLALAYVRNRTGTSDLVRTRRQRCFIREVVGQVDPRTVLFNFEGIASAIAGSAYTDIPIGVLPALVQVVAGVDTDQIGTMAIEQGAFSKGRNYRGLPIFDTADAQAAVRELLLGLDAGVPFVDGTECGDLPEDG